MKRIELIQKLVKEGMSEKTLANFSDKQIVELSKTNPAAALTLASVPPTNSQTLTIGNLPSVASTTVVFAAGDFLQLGNYV